MNGKINLLPLGQRPMIREACANLIQDMLFCNIRPGSMLFNRNLTTGVYDVVDGLQRTTKIVAYLTGMLPIRVVDDNGVESDKFIGNPHDKKRGYLALLANSKTPPTVVAMINSIMAIHGVRDPGPSNGMEINLADNELCRRINGIELGVQLIENWPARNNPTRRGMAGSEASSAQLRLAARLQCFFCWSLASSFRSASAAPPPRLGTLTQTRFLNRLWGPRCAPRLRLLRFPAAQGSLASLSVKT